MARTIMLVLLVLLVATGQGACAYDDPPPPAFKLEPSTVEELETMLTKADLSHRLNLAKIKNTFAEEKASAGLDARRDLIRKTRSVAGWFLWIFGGLALVSILGSIVRAVGLASPAVGLLSHFLPFGAKSAAFFVACIGGTLVVSHALQKFGPTLSDVAFWLVLGLAGSAFLAVGVPLAWAWVRSKIIGQAKALASKDEPRAAAALAATALGLTKDKHADQRKTLLEEFSPQPAH